MSPWEVYQACVTSLVNAGLAVIPNQHMLFPGWCCSEADCQGLWYNGSWPVPTYLACWQLVAERFASENLVVGYDLHNEPRPSRVNGELLVPSWGDGNQPTDIWLMYMGTIRRIQALAPGKLWFCEGLNYASNLAPAAAFPVGIPGTVYSLHDYSWFHPSGQNLTAYYNQMDAAGGYLVLDGQAPLWVGEFGANTDVATASLDTGWLADFLSWAQARRLHWCWWQLSAQAVKGTEPVTNTPKSQDGQRESYGLLSGHDWLGDQSDMLALLAPLMS
jgi:endoglucanase